ncbi:MAG: acetyl-CoA carboxylase biotin carboxyl carrier protein subunit [Bacteroidales bacterium]|nr:acetyl-CoA carboxylase biotin carboxyl carrier protein subunit [Bacteroidales bacterium]
MKKETKIRYNTINIDNVKYKTFLTKKFKNRKPYKKPELNIIKSFISGTIRNIYVKEGDKIKSGDKLVVLEAMKMRNDITAMTDGIVKKINVKDGENIIKGQVIVEIDA